MYGRVNDWVLERVTKWIKEATNEWILSLQSLGLTLHTFTHKFAITSNIIQERHHFDFFLNLLKAKVRFTSNVYGSNLCCPTLKNWSMFYCDNSLLTTQIRDFQILKGQHAGTIFSHCTRIYCDIARRFSFATLTYQTYFIIRGTIFRFPCAIVTFRLMVSCTIDLQHLRGRAM